MYYRDTLEGTADGDNGRDKDKNVEGNVEHLQSLPHPLSLLLVLRPLSAYQGSAGQGTVGWGGGALRSGVTGYCHRLPVTAWLLMFVTHPSTTMFGTPLDNWKHRDPMVYEAYKLCREIEQRQMLQQSPALTQAGAIDLEKKLINIHILGYLLKFAPTDKAQEHVAKTIMSDHAKNGLDASIITLGGFYDQAFLRTCKFLPSNIPLKEAKVDNAVVCKAKGCTPQLSHHSQLSFRVSLEDVRTTIKTHPSNHSEAKKSVSHESCYICYCLVDLMFLGTGP